MIRIRKVLAFTALALALSAAADVQAQSSAQGGATRWRGSRSEQLINQAVRHYGFRPNRLTDRQVDAIQETWYELFGGQNGRRTLSRAQATAIVYMALVHPYEEEGFYEDGRPGRPGGGWSGRDDPPPSRDDACGQMESDAYRLGNLVSAPEVNTGLFVADPEKARARTLARQIQQRAVECRATAVADRAALILRLLSEPLPRRSDVEAQVNTLKQAIRQDTGRR